MQLLTSMSCIKVEVEGLSEEGRKPMRTEVDAAEDNEEMWDKGCPPLFFHDS